MAETEFPHSDNIRTIAAFIAWQFAQNLNDANADAEQSHQNRLDRFEKGFPRIYAVLTADYDKTTGSS